MVKMMIVDDQSICRRGIRTCISWEKHGVHLVAEAENGRQALERADRHLPDIVITDIRMPVMDGLDFTQELLRRRPDTAVIVLSSYAEFEYARQALQLGVDDYLLRPFGAEELLEHVLQVKDKLCKRRDAQLAQQELSGLLLENVAAVRTGFLWDLLHGQSLSEEELSVRKQLLRIRLPAGKCRVLLLDTGAAAGSGRRPATRLVSRLDHALPREWGMAAMSADDRRVLLILPETVGLLEKLDSIGRTLSELALEETGTLPTLVASSPVPDLHSLEDAFHEARLVLEQKAYLPKGTLLLAANAPPSRRLRFDCPQEKKLLQAVKHLDFSNFYPIWNETVEDLRTNRFPFSSVRSFCLKFTAKIIQALEDGGYLIQGEAEQLNTHSANVVSACEHFDTLFDGCMPSLLSRFSNIREGGRKETGKDIVAAAGAYMEEHYGEPISLVAAAEHCGVSPAYLSRLFTRETGEAFTSRLNRIRIQAAKEMLRQDRFARIRDVGRQAGFSDHKHFSHVFRKLEQCLPSEYRDSAP